MICKSYHFTNIVRVEMYADSTDVIEFTTPFVVQESTISVGRGKGTSDSGCLIKKEPGGTSDAFEIQVYELSGELQVEESVSVSGRKNKCLLSFIIDRSKVDVFPEQLRCLRSNNYNILITYFDGSQHIIRSVADAWLCKTKESKGEIEVSIELENVSGAQQVV